MESKKKTRERDQVEPGHGSRARQQKEIAEDAKTWTSRERGLFLGFHIPIYSHSGIQEGDRLNSSPTPGVAADSTTGQQKTRRVAGKCAS